MKKLSLLLLASVTTLFANLEPLHVSLDIYSNKSFLNKTFKLKQSGEIKTKVPIYTTLANLRYKSSCKIENSNLSDTIKTPNIEIKELKNEKTKLTHNVKALLAKEILLKSLSLKRVDDFSKIDKISSYLTENLIKNAMLLESFKKEIKQIDKKLKNIKSVKEEYRELKISYTCKDEDEKLVIIYPQNSVKYTPFYNISANIYNKSVTIEKKATLFYKGVENFENIDLNIYSYRYNQNVAPSIFYPKYLKNHEPITYRTAMTKQIMDSVPKKSARNLQATYHELSTKSAYKIEKAKLIAGKNNLLHVDKELSNATFKTVIDAYGTNKAYLEATIKTKKDYSGAYANYFLGTNPLASRHMRKIKKESNTKLYFGEDEHIQIKKKLVKTLDEKTFFGDEKISSQSWKYTIINKKPFSTNVSFIQRVPISKDADIKVKTIATPKFDSQNAKGKTVWNFTLESKKTKNIIFGYEISNSK